MDCNPAHLLESNPSSNLRLEPPKATDSLETASLSRNPYVAAYLPPVRSRHLPRYQIRGPNRLSHTRYRTSALLRWAAKRLCLILLVYLITSILLRYSTGVSMRELYSGAKPDAGAKFKATGSDKGTKHDPYEWIRKHATLKPSEKTMQNKPRAALISLVRNEELEGILQSMRQLEHRWNKRYGYPWLFFSEVQFSDEFKVATTNATASRTEYHLIPAAHWHTHPSFANTPIYHDSLSYLPLNQVGKSHLPSYRSMCRWNSRFFYLHPALASYQYYWRIEPEVHFYCALPYDPFRFLHENDLIYGFNMNILDDARSFASLFARTKAFMHAHPKYLTATASQLVNWLIDETTGEYNGCQFFSNFEIGSLDFFRAEENAKFVEWLDSVEGGGGFWTERWGDAPVHTLSVVLFGKGRVWWFGDIGYRHGGEGICDQGNVGLWLLNGLDADVGGGNGVRKGGGVSGGLCDCERTSIDENFYRLVPMESPQQKPRDTCLRMWLGGDWLTKRAGWDREAERRVGGDGYGGYVKHEF